MEVNDNIKQAIPQLAALYENTIRTVLEMATMIGQHANIPEDKIEEIRRMELLARDTHTEALTLEGKIFAQLNITKENENANAK